MNLRITISALPIVVFFALERLGAPATVAIMGGFVASAGVFVHARKERLIGALTIFGFAIVAVSAAVGLVWQSEKAYLASGPVADFLFVGIFLGSIVIRQPLVGGIARELIPAIAHRVPAEAPVFIWLSVAWAGFNFFQGIGRSWMLSEYTVGEYVIWSRIVSWPFSAALLGLSAWLIYRAAERHSPYFGHEPVREHELAFEPAAVPAVGE